MTTTSPVDLSESPRNQPLYDFYRRFRRLLLRYDRSGTSQQLAESVLDAMVADTGEETIVRGGRVYRVGAESMVLVAKRGAAGKAPVGLRVPRRYGVVQELLARGFVVVMTTDPRIDREIEEQIGLEPYAAIAIGGPKSRAVVAFTLRDGLDPEELEAAFEILHSIADACWQGRTLTELLSQSAQIQTSLLPHQPRIQGFEIACRLRPADVVGGDFYDVTTLPTGTHAVTIGDATGHGLPAALQARDAIVGLRMGLEQQLKSVVTVSRLDRVLARSGSPARFVSLCYLELDTRGNLIYVNAGHVPPFILSADGSERRILDSTGPVLGLPPAASNSQFGRAFDRLENGEILILYTDGITEAEGTGRQELGIEPVVEAVLESSGSLEDAIDAAFERLDEQTRGHEQVDDQTLLLLRRKP